MDVLLLVCLRTVLNKVNGGNFGHVGNFRYSLENNARCAVLHAAHSSLATSEGIHGSEITTLATIVKPLLFSSHFHRFFPGFTALCEKYCNDGKSKQCGTDQLTTTLNTYLSQIVQGIAIAIA